MEGLRQYVISVTAAALLCAVISGLTQKSAAKELIRMLCGLVLAFTVLHPIVGIELADLKLDGLFSEFEAEQIAQEGERMTRDAISDIIKAETQAYILDKAAGLDAEITAEIILSNEEIPLPEKAIIRGEVSPDVRQYLTELLQTELGITKENQVWTG